MAGSRDDGTRAENKAHHPNRRPPKPIWDDPEDSDFAEPPFVRQMFQQGHGPVPSRNRNFTERNESDYNETYSGMEGYTSDVDYLLRQRPNTRYSQFAGTGVDVNSNSGAPLGSPSKQEQWAALRKRAQTIKKETSINPVTPQKKKKGK